MLNGFCEFYLCIAIKYQESSFPIPSSYPEKHLYFAFAELFIRIPARNNKRQLRSIIFDVILTVHLR